MTDRAAELTRWIAAELAAIQRADGLDVSSSPRVPRAVPEDAEPRRFIATPPRRRTPSYVSSVLDEVDD